MFACRSVRCGRGDDPSRDGNSGQAGMGAGLPYRRWLSLALQRFLRFRHLPLRPDLRDPGEPGGASC